MILWFAINHQNLISRGGSRQGPKLVNLMVDIWMVLLLALIGINYGFKTKKRPFKHRISAIWIENFGPSYCQTKLFQFLLCDILLVWQKILFYDLMICLKFLKSWFGKSVEIIVNRDFTICSWFRQKIQLAGNRTIMILSLELLISTKI